MTKPVFINEKSFSIQVATPSGAGRIVDPGFAVEGDYFLSSWRAGIPLRRLSDAEVKKFNRDNIVISITSSDERLHAEAVDPRVSQQKTFAPIPVAAEADADKAGRIEETLNTAMKDAGLQFPTPAEIEKMGNDQLQALAIRLGISGAGKRADLVKLLKERVSS